MSLSGGSKSPFKGPDLSIGGPLEASGHPLEGPTNPF